MDPELLGRVRFIRRKSRAPASELGRRTDFEVLWEFRDGNGRPFAQPPVGLPGPCAVRLVNILSLPFLSRWLGHFSTPALHTEKLGLSKVAFSSSGRWSSAE